MIPVRLGIRLNFFNARKQHGLVFMMDENDIGLRADFKAVPSPGMTLWGYHVFLIDIIEDYRGSCEDLQYMA